MNVVKLLLVKTAVDPRYRLSDFPSYLKKKVKVQLKFNVKMHISFEADQKKYFFYITTRENKTTTLCKFRCEEVFKLYSLCKIESNRATKEVKQQDSTD